MAFNGIRILGTRKPKGFNFKTRYSKDESEDKPKHNIHFSRMSSRTKSNKRTLIYLVILVVVVVYLIIYFNRLTVEADRHFDVEDIQVEAIE